jgi:hypothetical protein
MTQQDASNLKRSSIALVIFAWLFVSIPIAWGVFNSARTASRLFIPSTPTTRPVQ